MKREAKNEIRDTRYERRELTDQQQLAFKLVVVRRLKHREAAELMGISRPAVTRLMGRILGKEHKGTRHKNTSLTP